jgi:hypothetical protein
MKLLFTESRRRIELRQLFNSPRAKPDLLFHLSRGAGFGSLTVFNLARRDFQHFTPRRMAVLFYQSDSPIVEQRQRAGAAGMTNDFADDLDPVLFTQPVAFDVEYDAFEDFLRFQQLSWQISILSRPRYSIMRSFKRARRPDFCLEFQAKFLYLFRRIHKNRPFNNSLFSGKPQ